MMIIRSDIALRPRFQLELSQSKDEVLNAFEVLREPPFVVHRIDDHIFIKINRQNSHFWSPQLHLEVNETKTGSSRLHGLFGPNPTLWTFFIFLHFVMGVFLVLLLVWAYSNASLERPYLTQVGGMGLLVCLWLSFYAFGRAGRRRAKPQMDMLHRFMLDTIGAGVISGDNQSA